MAIKRFKDYKLEIIKMLFHRSEKSAVMQRIEELEESGELTDTQIQFLVDMVYNSQIFKMDRLAYVPEHRFNYELQILVYKHRIMASFLPSEDIVTLE